MRKAEVLKKKLERSHKIFYSKDIFWKHFQVGFSPTIPVDVLEIACGPGLFLRDLSKYIDIKYAVGTDVSEEMLNAAKRTLASSGVLGNVELLGLDFNSEEWPIEDQTYDLVFIGLSFRNISGPSNFLRNVVEHLRPDGRFAVFDFCRLSYLQFREQWIQYTHAEDLNDDFRQKVVDKYANFCRYGSKDVMHLCTEMGLEETYTTDLSTTPLTYLSFFKLK